MQIVGWYQYKQATAQWDFGVSLPILLDGKAQLWASVL